jgi:hypothetical protein
MYYSFNIHNFIFAEELKEEFLFYENGESQIGNICLGSTLTTRASLVTLFPFQILVTLP